MLFGEALKKDNISRILSAPEFRKALAELDGDIKKYKNTPIPALTFSLFKLYFTTGNRVLYENIYFERRGRLTAFTMAALLYERDEDIAALEDIIWDICDEYSWALPAHISDQGKVYDNYSIDLFAAETGFALAEVYYLLEKALDEKVTQRILTELERRIFTPYTSRSFWWENCDNNWAAVCAGSVGAAYIYAAPDRFDSVRERIIGTLSCFLSGFGDDGACLEGIGYWNYGFAYFTYFTELLKEFTYGTTDLLKIPKCKKIALFGQNAFMRKNYTVSFSDGYQQWCYLPGLTQRLYDIYGDEISAPPSEYAEFDEPCHRFPAYLRNFFWSAAGTVPHSKPARSEIYYPNAGWYILNRSRLSLAAKAGHNNEPHNHNDIGSFTLLSDNGYILCDFGCGEYCREYFDVKTRYDFLCNSSRGHNLPTIDGIYQRHGKDFYGEVICAENGKFTVELAHAYDITDLRSLIRSIRLTDDDVFSLCDTFTFSGRGHHITERFVTMTEPVLYDNGDLYIGDFRLIYDSSPTPKIGSEKLRNHNSDEVTMYMIDFELDDPVDFRLNVYSTVK